MALFKKKAKDEEEEFDEEERELEEPHYAKASRGRGRVRRGNFKDLNSKNSKKRKEPKKPWGKKERLFVLFVLLATVGSSAFLALSSRSWKVGGLPRITLPSFKVSNIKLFGEETIVLRRQDGKVSQVNQVAQVRQDEKAKKIQETFRNQTKDLTGVYGLYVVDLGTNYSFGVNENEVFEPASLNKLPIMAEMYKKAEEGSLSLSTKYKLKREDKTAGSGSLYTKPVGYELTYRDLIQYMGKESDNTAAHIARNILDKNSVINLISRVGMADTDIYSDNQTTTPRDVGIYFQKLWNGEILNQKDRDELLSFMTKTIYENWLAAGIPPEVRIAHKYGREVHVVNDVGIVFADELSELGDSPSRRPYVVVILSKGVKDKEADEIFPELSKAIYDIWTGD